MLYTDSGVAGEFEISRGVQVERVQLEKDGNASTPAGTAATTVYLGPYDQMKLAHEAIHQWARENGRRLAGPSWEVYGHWSDDPARLRTDIFICFRRHSPSIEEVAMLLPGKARRDLRFAHYWKSLSIMPDVAVRSYQMIQSNDQTLNGIDIDENQTQNDSRGGTVVWLSPTTGGCGR